MAGGSMSKIIIDAEFKNLIPALLPDEYKLPWSTPTITELEWNGEYAEAA
jgi:hypothetical protein